ncbi:MAG: hypothetical protein ABW252_17210 [Polyangiales bacterium]
MNHASLRCARSIFFASALVACATEPEEEGLEPAGERKLEADAPASSSPALVPMLRAGSIAAGCERGGKAFSNLDGTFGFELTGGLVRASDALRPEAGWFRADCDATLWFGPLPKGYTFVIDSAIVETVGTPGVSATLSMSEGWHGRPDPHSSLRGDVTLSESGAAAVTIRRVREADAPPECPPDGYLFARIGLETKLAQRGRVAETFGILKVDQIRLVARTCVVQS